jgi:endonuclease/exonuclease/phosphatase family metal-dependent hydrolase
MSGRERMKGERSKDGSLVLKAGTKHSVIWILLTAISVLLLLQSYKEFISSVYFYNLVGMGVSPVTVLLFLFLSPLVFGPILKLLGIKNSFLLFGALMLAGRLPMGMGLESPFHMIVSGITYISSAMMISLILSLHRREREVDPDAFSSQSLAGAFGLSLLGLLTLTAMGNGVDPSIIPEATGLILSPAISTAFCGFGIFLLFLIRDAPMLEDDRGDDRRIGSKITGGGVDSWAPAFGLGGFIFFAAGMVANPSVTTAWIGTSFQWALSMSIVSLGLFLLSLLSSSGYLLSLRRSLAHPKGAIIGNIIFLAAGLNMFYLHYPIPTAPAVVIWIGMVNTWMILDAMTDSRPFAGESFKIERKEGRKVIGFQGKSKERSFPGHFGKIMTIGLGVPTLVFTFVTLSLNWSFIPMGAVLKDTIPTFMFIGMGVLALTGFACSKAKVDEPAVRMGKANIEIKKGSPTVDAGKGTSHLRGSSEGSPRIRAQLITIGALTIVFIIITGVLSLVIYPGNIEDKNVTEGEIIRIVTYNVHHGFANDGRVDPSVQYEILEDIDADIIFLQESDSLRFTEGNFDPAFYYASRLDMFIFRGPDPGTGTPGVAILSKFRMEDLKVHSLPVDDIPRIAISARITIDQRNVRIVGLHMGLEEPEREKQLMKLRDLFNNFTLEYDGLIVGGDFNTEPHEEIMGLMNPEIFGENYGKDNISANSTGLRLQSVWHSVDEGGRNEDIDIPTFPAPDVDDEEQHIDYILFDDMFSVEKAVILEGKGASDHKPVWGELKVEP